MGDLVMVGGVRKFIKVMCDSGFCYLNCDHIVSVECYRNRNESQPESSVKFTMDNNKEFCTIFDINNDYDEFVDLVLDELYGHITGA